MWFWIKALLIMLLCAASMIAFAATGFFTISRALDGEVFTNMYRLAAWSMNLPLLWLFGWFSWITGKELHKGLSK